MWKKPNLKDSFIKSDNGFSIIHADALTIEVGTMSHPDDAVTLRLIMILCTSCGSVGESKMVEYELFELILSLSSEVSILVSKSLVIFMTSY